MLVTTTDETGSFALEVSKGQTIVVSSIGYQTQKIQYNGQLKLEIQMKASFTELEEVVVTGYQTQRKVDLTGAVSVC